MKFWPKVWGQGESSHGAEKQVAPLERIGAPAVSSSGPNARTDVRGEFTHITIEDEPRSELRYEFFLPEPIPLQVWPSGSASFATQDPATTDGRACVAGSGATYRGRAGASRPVFSEVLEPTEDGPQFQTRPIAPLYQNDTEPTGVVQARNFFPTWASWQNQKGPEHIHWVGGDGNVFVTSPRGFGPGLANMAGFWMPAWLPSTGIFLVSYANDVGKDVAMAFYESGKRWPRAGAPSLPSYIDWRRAAVQIVEGRKFFVLSDSHGYFHVMPVENYLQTAADFRAVPSDRFFSYLPPYPGWVSGPASAGVTSRPATSREAFLWQFNAAGTRAVGVPFREQEGEAWYTDGSAVALTSYFLFGSDPVHLNQFQDPNDYPFPTYMPGYVQCPGLVELGITITVTGTEAMDFEVAFEVLQESFYEDNGGRYYVDAAYRMPCERLGDQAEGVLGAAQDALITAEIELFWDEPAGNPRIGRNDATEDHVDLPDYDIRIATVTSSVYGLRNRAAVFYTVRNHETQEVIRRFRLCGKFGDKPLEPMADHMRGPQNILGYADLRSLTFMFSTLHSDDGTTLSGDRACHVFAWNEHVGSASEFAPEDPDADIAHCQLLDGPGDLMALPAGDTGNEDTLFFWLQLACLYLVRLSFFRTFPVHPRGHWASCLALDFDPTGSLDMIQAYRANGEAMERTSHREEYNAAFAQDRQPDFHDGAADIAPMATTGIWRYT
jgi:hypothetical protein